MAGASNHLAAIVARARSLTERLAAARDAPGDLDDDQAVARRLARWREVAADGDAAGLGRRWAWDGITSEAARRALADDDGNDNDNSDDSPDPPWVAVLRAIVEAGAVRPLAAGVDEVLPFAELFEPCMRVARVMLAAHTSDLTARARARLEHSLLRRLTGIGVQALAHEFGAAGRQRLLQSFGGDPVGPVSSERYARFVADRGRAGLAPLFARYPVLARLVAEATRSWVAAAAEMWARLAADRPALERTFGAGGAVVDLEPDLSDPTCGGRTVTLLRFSSGATVVYKPKDVGAEAAFGRFTEWFNDHAELPLRAPQVIERDGHGWAEFIARAPCPDLAAVRRFYRRAGALLCVMYVLGGVDGHAGNWVVAGEQLVLVDMETLMYPVLAGGGRDDTPDSALRTGLLPVGDDASGPVRDMSGLGFGRPQAAPRRRWRYLNTDDMHLGWEPAAPPERSIPVLDGAPVSPHEFADDLVAGFERGYRVLMARRAALLAADGPLVGMAGRRVRFAFRNTGGYLAVLAASLAPEALRSGVDRSLELERLARVFVAHPEPPWPILRAELQALERRDIPWLGGDSDSDALTVGLARPLACFAGNGHARMLARVHAMDETDLKRQLAAIAGAVRR